ncbi:hypothetical protein [Nocardiopsis ansamitocini]|uniref:Uncharacterized protein n=1 Tax=Nocardiopsis ansamitocini TaxID=1670832 RepID=A0A9W6UG53_9ACTN|nr:hypothetical protein [Nocardiopsis ansamitocini]GLU46591.1 hypothetical protein Nans01_09420 [Nocardiopsis ansamitocini]
MDDHQPGADAARTNQARTEPLPATPESDPGQRAVRRNEELGAHGAAAQSPVRGEVPGEGEQVLNRIRAGVPAADAPLDAPGVQAARSHPDGDDGWQLSQVANSVRGRPDGEVDTRADQPANGSETP